MQGENGCLLHISPTQRWPRKAMAQKIFLKGRASEDAPGNALCMESEVAQGKTICGPLAKVNGLSGVLGA